MGALNFPDGLIDGAETIVANVIMAESQDCTHRLVDIRASGEAIGARPHGENVIRLKVAGIPPHLGRAREPESARDISEVIALGRWREIQDILGGLVPCQREEQG
jgi:hypothetical protein